MSKNIVMQELTDNGYDALYPKTSADQIEGISEYDWKIGDVRCTVRSDLGDKWALCNGDKFKPEDYPEITNILMPTWDELKAHNSESMFFYSIAFHDGLWVGVGKCVKNDNAYASIYTTRDLTVEWTKKYEATYSQSFGKVIYANGYWVATSNYNRTYPELAYSNNGESWFRVYFTTSFNGAINSIAYYNGQWVAVGQRSDTNEVLIWTSTNLTQSSSWSFQSLRNVGTPLSVMCVNGLWTVLGFNGQNGREKYVYTTNNPAGTWNKNTISNSFSFDSGDIIYQDGLYKAIFSTYDEPKGTYLYTTTDPTGVWNESYITDILLNSMDYYNGILRAVGKRDRGASYVCQIHSLNVSKEQELGRNTLYSIACANNQWVIGAGAATFYSTYGFPLITSDLTYNYIKAKP